MVKIIIRKDKVLGGKREVLAFGFCLFFCLDTKETKNQGSESSAVKSILESKMKRTRFAQTAFHYKDSSNV
ncbi:MAG: hypothetical protein C0525_03310 [Flavobacterium sp.]|nr:hypothetical protein [Flavobacterium sp.]